MNCPYCSTSIDEHESSRCLDAWVFEVVFRAIPDPNEMDGEIPQFNKAPFGETGTLWQKAPHFSISIQAAWEVVEKLNNQGFIVEIVNDCVAWSVRFINIDTKEQFFADWQATLEMMICRAALKAIEGGDDAE